MKSFCWAIALVCFFSLQSGRIEVNAKPSVAAVTAEARFVIETAKEGIETADKALDLYNRIIDRVIPWKEFNETLVELDAFRKDYSTQSAALIGEIKTLMLNGIDAYFSASQCVYEWTGLAIPLLKAYIKLFNTYNEVNAGAQRSMLLQVLDSGMKKLGDSQEELKKSSRSFNNVAGKLVELNTRFEFEFNEKSEFVETKITQVRIGAYTGGALFGIPGVTIAYFVAEGKLIPELMKKLESIQKFYDTLREKADKAGEQIEDTKKILQREVHEIGEIKTKTGSTKSFVELDYIKDLKDEVIASANELIDGCNEYRKRHINKTEFA